MKKRKTVFKKYSLAHLPAKHQEKYIDMSINAGMETTVRGLEIEKGDVKHGTQMVSQ